VKEKKMPLPTGDVLGILKDNLQRRGSVLPISKGAATRWAKELDIPYGGETVLYTGEMYQLVPYIDIMVNYIDKLEDTPLARFVKLGRLVNKVFNISAFFSLLAKREAEGYDRILRNAALLLRKAGVDYGYLYGDELYCGAIVYRSGLDDCLEQHALKVYRMLKERGVKTLITMDPHTTDLLRLIYPSMIDGFDISVKTYMEVLAGSEMHPERSVDMEVVVHDSCCYARYEGIVEEPRILLERANFRFKEPRDSRKFTMCCGGPIEALYPKKAFEIAEKRVQQLKEVGENIVVTCPLCLTNLRKAARDGTRIDDLVNYLAMAYL
jgi:Fe-S oxidoreductase